MFLFSEPIVVTTGSCEDVTGVPPDKVLGGICFAGKLRFDDPAQKVQDTQQRKLRAIVG
jgi:hypothetical protein